MRRVSILLSLLLAVMLSSPARAWLTVGHHELAVAATDLLSDDVPAFVSNGAEVIGAVAEDPDYWKMRDTPQLRAAEYPEHFLDFEELDGMPLPPDRYKYVAALIRRGKDPARVGTLPYAVAEGIQKLTLSFAEYRCWPRDPAIQQKILIYAGRLAHYAADLEQPLHTTVDYDGRVDATGRSPRSGIHFRVDELIQDVPLSKSEAIGSCSVPPLQGELLDAVMTQFQKSHALVDRVYSLIPPPGTVSNKDWHPDEIADVKAFTAERFCASAGFIAAAIDRAWHDSAGIELPLWQREGKPRTYACRPN